MKFRSRSHKRAKRPKPPGGGDQHHGVPPPPGPFHFPGIDGPIAGQPNTTPDSPLHRAVQSGNIDMMKLLLRRGADSGRPGMDGRSAQQIADAQNAQELATLLRSGLLLEGPSLGQKDKARSEDALGPVSRALPPPRDNSAKMAACRSFEATMVEFYIDDQGRRHQRSAPVYDLLYGESPQAILGTGRPEGVDGKSPNFTWYHLPANNVRASMIQTPTCC